ncbi:MAG: hypothetical protein ABIU10_02210 [Sphingomicrobium sp.]
MPSKYLYLVLLISCSSYAWWRGRSDERVAAAVCLLATALSHLVLILNSPAGRFHQLETGILVIDVLAFLGFVSIALWSQRFWPLYVAGLQLTSLLAHFARVSQIDLLPVAYAAAERFWSYPILIIIAVGAWRQHRRSLDSIGHPA